MAECGEGVHSMSADICLLCGKDPAAGFATVPEGRLCHPDEGQDCYHLWTVYRKRPQSAYQEVKEDN